MPQETPVSQPLPRPTIRERDAAEYIGMSPDYLRKARRGIGTPGPAFIRAGRAIRYRIRDLEAWLDAHLQGGAREPKARRPRGQKARRRR